MVEVVVWLPAAARAHDESWWLVASASSWLLLVGSLKASDCALMRKFRFFEVFGVGMVGGWVA